MTATQNFSHMNSVLIFVFSLFPVFYIFQGLTTGEIIIHGYNRSEKRYNRANRDSEPAKFWGYIVFYTILTLVLAFLAIFGDFK